MIATTNGFTLDGINARPVRVEVDVRRGLPNFAIVGLPDAAVREARERVRAAMVNSGYEFPLTRITVSLSPTDLRKSGPSLDLAIAAALLASTGEITTEQVETAAFAGELSLDGSVRPVRGAVAMSESARDRDLCLVVPAANTEEAMVPFGANVKKITHLAELRNFDTKHKVEPVPRIHEPTLENLPDLADLRGQSDLRTALEVAAAGGHSLLMVGSPGCGKSLAARRLPSILPPLTSEEILEVARIQSSTGIGNGHIDTTRPFRAPHHTVSAAGLVGGGTPLRPGEITLAHRGVLFLDELVEFSRTALEAMREPIETGKVTISRGNHQRMVFPAQTQLIAAANPCACGFGEFDQNCRCSEASMSRYRTALAGALAGRIDMHIGVTGPTTADLTGPPGESSATVRQRVLNARERMTSRYGDSRPNAQATIDEISQFDLSDSARAVLNSDQLLTGRTGARTLAMARTLADLADLNQIGEEQITKALGYTHRGDLVTN